MPAWPGGPCPGCGEDMPENLVHCRTCRTLLNQDLVRDSVEIPAFFSLPELDAIADVQAEGAYVKCENCQRELKIARKYFGRRVQCKSCRNPFRVPTASTVLKTGDLFSHCPHCSKTLRFAPKYRGRKVACRFCGGKIAISTDETPADEIPTTDDGGDVSAE